MVAYMRHQFPFLGVKAPAQKAAWAEATAGLPRVLPEDVVVDAAVALWERPEREHQYVACRLVNRHAESRTATPHLLSPVGELVSTKSWWDTVDALATHATGTLVRRFPKLAPTMDEWLDGELWRARTALLHMNRWKAATDPDWLFAACLRRSADTDFFIRKAIGWALREYSKTDEEAVVAFVEQNADRLSGLSHREALMWLTRRARRTS
jgi:3-methyladenine DNA glycosylase AlkD